jgi:protease I
MEGSHSLAKKAIYKPVTSEMNSIGNDYKIPIYCDNGPEWLASTRVLVISADGPELPEIDIPIDYLRKHGANVDLAGQDWIFAHRKPPGYIIIAQWLADNICVKADLALSTVRMADYDAVFIPGGAWNQDMLRTDDAALKIVREARAQGKLIISLCHGPQVLINVASSGSDVFPPGTKITGVGNIRVDLKNAGFVVSENDPVVYDEPSQLLTARGPDDLGPLCEKMGCLLRSRRLGPAPARD